jgi:hypothetical protein
MTCFHVVPPEESDLVFGNTHRQQGAVIVGSNRNASNNAHSTTDSISASHDRARCTFQPTDRIHLRAEFFIDFIDL